MRDHGVSNGEQSALVEKSKRENIFSLLQRPRWGEKKKREKINLLDLLVLQARELPTGSYLKEALRRSF